MPRDQRLFMTFPIDFWTHPKVARLSDSAFRAFVEANGHSRMRETDGVLEADDAEFLWKPEVLSELVKSHPSRPLMIRLESGEYMLRDYAEHQFTKADRDELSQKRAEAGRLGGKARASAKQVLSNPEQSEAEIGIEQEIEEEKKREAPSSPKRAPASRGSRIPRNFTITDEMRAWAAVEAPLVDLDRKLPEFIDYWAGVAGEKGVKLDWVSTWRNGMRKQQQFALRDAPANAAPYAGRKIIRGGQVVSGG